MLDLPEAMTRWKKRFVVATVSVLSLSILVFLVTGYTALYWGWLRANSEAALPYLPWARNSGMLAMAGAALAFAVLFSPKIFPISPKLRLWISLLASAAIAFFSEFRNEGKFYFRTNVHFFKPGSWMHDDLNRIVPSLGDFLYRMEYSHWNDFLMGPAIASALFVLVFAKLYGAFRDQEPLTLSAPAQNRSVGLDQVLRFARTLMNIGLFWFFIQAWAEKAGYVRNHYSNDEIDLPFEFAGTMLGFWMTRVLTKPFGEVSENFRSTLLVDFLSAGVVGLLYTLIIGPLTEGIASVVAHALQPSVAASLNFHEYTPFQQHMRPVELLLLAGAMWWGLNKSWKHEQMIGLSDTHGEPEPVSTWDMLITLAKPLGVITGYLLILTTMLSVLEPDGLGSTLAIAGAGLALGTGALLLVKWAGQRGLTTLFGSKNETAEGTH